MHNISKCVKLSVKMAPELHDGADKDQGPVSI